MLSSQKVRLMRDGERGEIGREEERDREDRIGERERKIGESGGERGREEERERI